MKRAARTLIIGLLLSSGSVEQAGAQLVDNQDGTVTDQGTGLMWLAQSEPAPGEPEMTWREAMFWAAGLSVAGYDDWRLPSALDFAAGTPDLLWLSQENEWGQLYGGTWGNPAGPSDIAPMTRYPAGEYWTSTEHPAAGGEAAAFFVSYDGLFLNDFHPKTSLLRYTAVRGDRVAILAPECSDGYDNDGQNGIDYPEDVGCSSAEDASEFTCFGSRCLLFGRLLRDPWPCFKIEDSTFCLEREYVVVGVIVVVGIGWWWYRRRRRRA